jgi:hypothetical protein
MTYLVEINKRKAREDENSELVRHRCEASKREKRYRWEVEAEAHDKKEWPDERVTSKFTNLYANI